MANIDVPLRRLVQRRAKDWVKFLIPDCPDHRVFPVETEKTPVATSRLDEAFEIDDPNGAYILHFEPQAYHQKAFPVRMLRYRSDLWEALISAEKDLLPIRQMAVFFFPEHENTSHHLTDTWDGQMMIDYTYKVIRMWEYDRNKVIEQKLVGLYPLLPLMRGEGDETLESSLEQTVAAIQTVENHALQMDLVAVFGIIGSSLYDPDIIRTYVRREMLMESPIYNEWVEEERKEAKEEEKIEIAKKMIQKGMEVHQIQEFTGLSKERIEKLLQSDD